MLDSAICVDFVELALLLLHSAMWWWPRLRYAIATSENHVEPSTPTFEILSVLSTCRATRTPVCLLHPWVYGEVGMP